MRFLRSYTLDYLPPPTKEYDDSYNTIPEDMNTGYDIQITPENDPWRIPYVPRDPGYFGPVIPIGEPPVYRDPPPNTISMNFSKFFPPRLRKSLYAINTYPMAFSLQQTNANATARRRRAPTSATIHPATFSLWSRLSARTSGL